MKLKKSLWLLGSLSSTIMPITMVIACGNNEIPNANKVNENPNENKEITTDLLLKLPQSFNINGSVEDTGTEIKAKLKAKIEEEIKSSDNEEVKNALESILTNNFENARVNLNDKDIRIPLGERDYVIGYSQEWTLDQKQQSLDYVFDYINKNAIKDMNEVGEDKFKALFQLKQAIEIPFIFNFGMPIEGKNHKFVGIGNDETYTEEQIKNNNDNSVTEAPIGAVVGVNTAAGQGSPAIGDGSGNTYTQAQIDKRDVPEPGDPGTEPFSAVAGKNWKRAGAENDLTYNKEQVDGVAKGKTKLDAYINNDHTELFFDTFLSDHIRESKLIEKNIFEIILEDFEKNPKYTLSHIVKRDGASGIPQSIKKKYTHNQINDFVSEVQNNPSIIAAPANKKDGDTFRSFKDLKKINSTIPGLFESGFNEWTSKTFFSLLPKSISLDLSKKNLKSELKNALLKITDKNNKKSSLTYDQKNILEFFVDYYFDSGRFLNENQGYGKTFVFGPEDFYLISVDDNSWSNKQLEKMYNFLNNDFPKELKKVENIYPKLIKSIERLFNYVELTEKNSTNLNLFKKNIQPLLSHFFDYENKLSQANEVDHSVDYSDKIGDYPKEVTIRKGNSIWTPGTIRAKIGEELRIIANDMDASQRGDFIHILDYELLTATVNTTKQEIVINAHGTPYVVKYNLA